MVPKGWKPVTLGSVTVESAFGPRFSSDLYNENGSVGTIRTTDLDDEGNINYSGIPYADLPESFQCHYLKTNDLLITRSGSCGIPCIFEEQKKPIIAGAFLIRFILNEKVDPKYIHTLLKSEKIQKEIQNLASGGVQKNLTGTNLKKVRFPLPPLPEQKKIAKIFSTWDKAITTTEKLLANSQQQKKALMQQLLTGKNRLLDGNGRRFKGEWPEYLLGDISKITTGSSNRQDSHLTGSYTFFDRSEDIRTSDTYLFDCEAVIVPGEGQDFIPKYFVGKFDLHQRTYAIMNFPRCYGKFLFYSIHYFRSHFLSQAVGSTVKSLRLPMFQKMKLKLPKLDEQQKIAHLLSAADQEISALQNKLSSLKNEKKALMQQLLMGKRRVKVEEAA